MDWPAIQEAIRVAVVSATGILDARVQWENTPQAGGWMQEPTARLSIKQPQGVGVDETRYTYDAGADALIPSQEGVRTVLVTVKIQAQSQLPGSDAPGTLADRLRTRLRRPSVLAALQAAGVALGTFQPTVNADRKLDGRMISVALTDVVFSIAETDTEAAASVGYIQRVTGTGTLDKDKSDQKTIPLDVSRA